MDHALVYLYLYAMIYIYSNYYVNLFKLRKFIIIILLTGAPGQLSEAALHDVSKLFSLRGRGEVEPVDLTLVAPLVEPLRCDVVPQSF